ncbi:hypothetical protein [Streptomyces buecherae]|uniref:PH domain-containing protein n=1 Tax=Streptomyces buecherae TaxID=2763006 RepID=A0A7H8N7D2_9ACTN|nr:hypothetical protein [Streptomyces buecherae]QKW50454.1 hypothetical protein HUT08_13965 [Streptomyces buecherae]
MVQDDIRDRVPSGAMPRRSALTWAKAMFSDLAAWLTRKPVTHPGAHRAIRHSADSRTIIWSIAAADLVASVVVDAMVPAAYRPLHLVWVVVSVVMTVGFCAMTARTPHLIDDHTLYLRTGPFRALAIPLRQIQTVRTAHGMTPSHGLRRSLDEDDAVACSVAAPPPWPSNSPSLFPSGSARASRPWPGGCTSPLIGRPRPPTLSGALCAGRRGREAKAPVALGRRVAGAVSRCAVTR